MSKMKQPLNRLTVAEATRGMNIAIENSVRLLEDAKLLLDAGSYPTALSITILAIEEAGKVSVLRGLLKSKDENLKEGWKDYRNHRAKNAAWILPELALKGAKTLFDLYEATNKKGQHTLTLDTLKQRGFYSDFLGKGAWAIPSEIIDKNLAEGMWKIASILCKKREITEKENELWVKHLGPESQHGISIKGLIAYFSEAYENGVSPHDNETVMKFIYGDIKNLNNN